MAKRKHKKRPSAAVRIGELATPERREQLGGVMTEVVGRDASGKAYVKRHRARIECMVDNYHESYRLNDPQHMAGIKFREIYLRVNYGTNSKVLCNPFLMQAAQCDPEGKALAHINCLRLLEEACRVLTPKQFEIVRNVCGHDEYAGGHDNMETLVRGLDRLAKFWGYI